MTLLPIHETRVVLPPYWIDKRHICGNTVLQLGNPAEELDCELFRYEHALLLAKCQHTDQYYLTLPKCRAPLPDGAVVRLVTPIQDVGEIGPDSVLRWVQHPSDGNPQTPEEIVRTWKGQFIFHEEDVQLGRTGLRRPQLGALHAIAGHLTVNTDPATIVMPTGLGKTDTMLSTLVYCECTRVLVLVPSDALRDQLSRKFLALGCLPEIGVLPKDTCRPRVASIKRRITDPSIARELASYANVLVATPNVLNASSAEAQRELLSACSHLFVDEAHHVSAPTWRRVKQEFKDKPVLQFTATPFRRDGGNLEGQIIFNYPLSLAQQDGYFKHIRLYHVEEYDEPVCDRAVAEESIRVLRADLAGGLDHLLMARVNSIERASTVMGHYRHLCPELEPVVVHSRMRKAERDVAIQAVKARASRVIVCVDMLGEGFDLPNLKIAALHDIHKSLAVTLQFIGRFTRTTSGVGDAAVVVDISDPKVRQELQALYAENADWDKVLRHQSESAIAKELAQQRLIDSFKQNGTLAEQLSLWNLRPAFSTTIYQTECEGWTPLEYATCLSDKHQHWHALSTSEDVLVVVVAREEEVKWGKYREIKDSIYELLVAHWDADQQALFIHCTDDDFFRELVPAVVESCR